MCNQYTFPVHNISLDMAFEALQSEEVFNFCKTPSPSPPDLAFVFLQVIHMILMIKLYFYFSFRWGYGFGNWLENIFELCCSTNWLYIRWYREIVCCGCWTKLSSTTSRSRNVNKQNTFLIQSFENSFFLKFMFTTTSNM